MNELQQEIFDEIVDHLVPTMDKYEEEDSLIVLKEIVSIVERALMMRKWISVKDHLPNADQFVLAFDTARIYIAKMQNTNEYNEHWGICEESCCSCIGCTGAITHWMPLPEPPNDSLDKS